MPEKTHDEADEKAEKATEKDHERATAHRDADKDRAPRATEAGAGQHSKSEPKTKKPKARKGPKGGDLYIVFAHAITLSSNSKGVLKNVDMGETFELPGEADEEPWSHLIETGAIGIVGDDVDDVTDIAMPIIIEDERRP